MHLFDGVRYSLSTSLSESRINELSHVLDSNGASCVQSIDDAALTHFITNSNSFEGWQEIATREEEGYLVVVTDKWVDKSLILGKLQHSSFYSADPAMIFSGVVACAAELETTDLEVLSAGITALGGQWRTGLTKDVTHLFVTKNTSAKYSTAMHFRNDTHVKILLPHWFDDAVRLGIGGLDTTPYEWPDPPMLRAHGAEDGEGAKGDAMKRSALRKLDNEKKSLYRTVDLLFPGAPLPNDEERMSESTIESPRGKSKNVWEGRRVLLGRSLELSGSRRDAVEAEIRRAGGKIVSYEGGKDEEAAAIDECDVLITRFRSGKAYVQAIRHNKTIGTLPWVFHVHSIGTLSPPMDQLLWYPIPKRPIEGFSGHEITVTNYTGESREYIKKLIIAMGAVFTPSMSGKNTVLIAAYISGQKTEKAASWSIPIVNHLWLEDCFVKWRNLTVALEKYIVFPPGVDFSRQLGDRGVGRGVEEIGEDDLEADGDGDLHMQVELQAFQVEVEELTTTKMAENEDEDEDEPMEEEEEPPASFRPTLTPRSTKSIVERIQDKGESAAKTRIKSRSQGRPKEDRGATPEVAITKRKSGQSKVTPMKKRSRVDSGSSTSSDDEFEIVEATAKRASKKLVRRVGERNDTWIMDAVEVTPLRPEKAAYESRDESEQEEDVPQKPRSRVLKKSPSKRILSDEESEKMTRKRSRKDLFIDDEADDAGNHESNAISVKEGKKRAKLDEEEEEESSVEAKSRNAVMKPSMSSKGGGRGTRPSWESEDEDMDVVSTSKSKAKPKMVEVERPRPKPTAKAKKFVEPSAFAEENESSLSLQPAAVKSRTSFSKSKKIFTPPVSDEDEPSTSRKTIVQPRASTSKSRKAPKLLTPDEDHSPAKRSATKPGPSSSKSKKISPSMLDEDDEPSPSKKHASKTTALASKKSKKATAPPVLSKAVSEDEDEDDGPQRASKTYAIKSNGHSKPSTDLVSLTTPKRTVSVLLPGLSLSTKKASQSKDVASTSLSHSDSIRVVANERASRGRTATTSGSATKAKAKAKPAPAPSRSMSPPPTTDDDTPVISSGRAKRGAAARASQKLHEEIMPDVMTFQQEMRNVGKGRRSLGAISMPGASGSANKRHLMDKSSDEEEGHSRNVKRPRLSTSHAMKGKATAGQEDQEENEPSRPVKGKGKKKPDDDGEGKGKPAKSKTTKVDGVDLSVDSKPGTVRLMTTQVPLSDDVAKVLIKLGVKITVKPSECTHLLAPHLVRTEKFLCALASAPFIMTDRWAIESAAAKKLLDERNYLLRDKINEKKFDFVLADALSRAKKLRGTLFSKMVFYITPKVSVNIQLLKNVVTACGGQVNTQIPTLRIMNASNDRYLISCPADAAIWRPIASTHPIYTQELILTSALRQEIDWDNENYRVPNSIFR
ncbi:BRCT-containing protein 1 [Termitomyces sp. J132]|nr:BRCT-containing protein 1 [Termitomyces sp. J132]